MYHEIVLGSTDALSDKTYLENPLAVLVEYD